jgi:hypothetical protein
MGAGGLNFRVRDGTGWTPAALITNRTLVLTVWGGNFQGLACVAVAACATCLLFTAWALALFVTFRVVTCVLVPCVHCARTLKTG